MMEKDRTGVRLSFIGLVVFAVIASGCSARDPVDKTPVYHVGTPTNRSSVQSWEPNSAPFFTQPGVDPGAPAPPLPAQPSERGYEPYDPLATAVYSSMLDNGIQARYISVTAKNGTVVLEGSADDDEQREQSVQVAMRVDGVHQVIDDLTVPPDR